MHNLVGGLGSYKENTLISLSSPSQVPHHYLPLAETTQTAGAKYLMDAVRSCYTVLDTDQGREVWTTDLKG